MSPAVGVQLSDQKEGRKRMGGERRRRGVGPSHGSGETQVRQPGNVKSPAIQDVGRKYPSGKRLRPVEFAVSKQHRPRDPVSGKPICWILTRCTASARGCPFCPHREMKQWGLHWVARAQMARRGGFKGGKLLSAAGSGGFSVFARNGTTK